MHGRVTELHCGPESECMAHSDTDLEEQKLQSSWESGREFEPNLLQCASACVCVHASVLMYLHTCCCLEPAQAYAYSQVECWRFRETLNDLRMDVKYHKKWNPKRQKQGQPSQRPLFEPEPHPIALTESELRAAAGEYTVLVVCAIRIFPSRCISPRALAQGRQSL